MMIIVNIQAQEMRRKKKPMILAKNKGRIFTKADKVRNERMEEKE